MKIGNPAEKHAPPPVPASNAAAAPNASAAAAAGAIPAQADPSTNVALSSTASTLLDGNSNAEFDSEKVARISKSIDDGSFKINPEAIADKLISNAQELLSKVQP